MNLCSLHPGDQAIVVWQHPATPDLNGTEQLVSYNGPCRGDAAFVDRYDIETHEHIRGSWRAIADCEVVAIVARKTGNNNVVDDGETDPLMGGRRSKR
jgi:hypothetical protein